MSDFFKESRNRCLNINDDHILYSDRKTSTGEVSKTWDRYQMRIHKRVIDLESSDYSTLNRSWYGLGLKRYDTNINTYFGSC